MKTFDDAPVSATAARLLIPTNPEVDLVELAPREFEYANPVTLNNLLILYANARIELGGRSEEAHKAVEAAKLARRKAERQLEAFEARLLREKPAPRGVSTLKLIAAHLAGAAFLDGTSEQYIDLQEAVQRAEDAEHAANAQVRRYKDWADTIEAAVNSITVHLSYIKHEWRDQGRR